METIIIKTKNKEEFIEITDEIIKAIEKMNINEGGIILFCPHTTAGLTINENADKSVKADILMALDCLPFKNLSFSHSEGNSISHIKASLMGCSITLIIKNNKPILGTWQGVFFCEFDGPRTRKVYIYKL